MPNPTVGQPCGCAEARALVRSQRGVCPGCAAGAGFCAGGAGAGPGAEAQALPAAESTTTGGATAESVMPCFCDGEVAPGKDWTVGQRARCCSARGKGCYDTSTTTTSATSSTFITTTATSSTSISTVSQR
ncbi:unnamed protein product [Prorocentrum cordatum]|uniref:Uncharacterized protein n=1 Tax=Prorocentrum cordatum TaxID=2364126 RepID=A0ABN9VY34_9DINO|nr:unnamed protein product [Polarella glacialis]